MSLEENLENQARRLPRELARLGPRELLVTETFASIQGESSYAGRPCFFVRLTGCHLRCGWCDTEYAFHGGERRSVDDCVAAARDAGIPLVEVTGGEPLLQPAVDLLLAELCDAGFEVLLETSGAIGIGRVDPRVRRIVDQKAPGSGEASRNVASIIDDLRAGDELKIVLADRADYEWTRAWLEEARQRQPLIGTEIPVWLSPVWNRLPARDLAAWLLADRLPVRLGSQLHKTVWDPDARGV